MSPKRRAKKDVDDGRATPDAAARAERARSIHEQIDALRDDAAAGVEPAQDPRRPARPPRPRRGG